jgi:hypothetical protein
MRNTAKQPLAIDRTRCTRASRKSAVSDRLICDIRGWFLDGSDCQ